MRLCETKGVLEEVRFHKTAQNSRETMAIHGFQLERCVERI